MCAVGQVDRVEVVEVPVGELHQAGAVDVDLVEVERLLVVRLEAERGPSGRRRRGRAARRSRAAAAWGMSCASLPSGAEPVEHQQPAAGHGHVAQPVPRLVRPLGALREGHVDEERPCRSRAPGSGRRSRRFDLADLEVEAAVRAAAARPGCSRARRARPAPRRNRPAGLRRDPPGQVAGPADFAPDPLRRRAAVGLVQPVAPERLVGLVRRRGSGSPACGGVTYGATASCRYGRNWIGGPAVER